MKIAIIGYGKMGRVIENIAQSQGHETVLKIGRQNREKLNCPSLQKADVAIEFSRPGTAFENVALCLKCGLPVVSGTTGWLDSLPKAKALCEEKKGAFFYASNFSIGVNVFFALSRQLAAMMESCPGYEVRVEEIHHVQKLDYPSGTAITLAEGLLENMKRKNKWSAKMGNEDEPPPPYKAGTIPIVSVRKEGVPGTHVLRWESEMDSIEIRHTAHSREAFARGALKAAEWLIGRQGIFGMEDLLNLDF